VTATAAAMADTDQIVAVGAGAAALVGAAAAPVEAATALAREAAAPAEIAAVAATGKIAQHLLLTRGALNAEHLQQAVQQPHREPVWGFLCALADYDHGRQNSRLIGKIVRINM